MAKGPTTRRGRFEKRRQRYAHRLKRRRWSYPYLWDTGFGVMQLNHADGPYVFEGDGSHQQAMNKQLVKPEPGPYITGVMPPSYTVSPANYQHPPHVSFVGGDVPNPSHNREALINYHHRSQTYRGKKVGKHKGEDFFACRAWWWSQMRLFDTGTREWPPWDPLHRTPVWVDWPD